MPGPRSWNALPAGEHRTQGDDLEAAGVAVDGLPAGEAQGRGKGALRLERFGNYTDYLNDTFRAGGRATILLWRWNDGLMHWMGIIREKGQIKIMDPARGRYVSFQQGISYWEYGDHKPEFLVFGFVRK